MKFLVASLIILFLASVLSLFFKGQNPKRMIALGGTVLGSAIGLYPVFSILSGSPLVEWQLLGLDALSAFFLLPIFGLSLLISFYYWDYIKGDVRLLKTLPFYPLLIASMVVVVSARDGFLLIMSWEVMSLASFFLVTVEHESREVRRAGWIYLGTTHLATAFLLGFFILMFKESGSFLFSSFNGISETPIAFRSILFISALVGFGTKAGIFPFHVWLPHAHPAAPSPVSAIMSGVMIKTGIYGILRTLTFVGAPPVWWGELLVVLGILSAVLGVLFALMQHDIKRLLAYHSVENIGIITIGIGLGVIGISLKNTTVAVLGFSGAIFHVLNHAIFKSGLFLGAGSVVHETGTRSIDRLGGLLKKMPLTGLTFLIASAAICGLPPFNGFISEWLIYLGLFDGSQNFFETPLFMSVAGIIGIAFAGGLAVACFTKVYGVVFLGESRDTTISNVHETTLFQIVPMLILAMLCLVLGVYPQIIWGGVVNVVQGLYPQISDISSLNILAPLSKVGLVTCGMIILFFVLLGLYKYRFWKKAVRRAVTWDCGYSSPIPSMQYTASSFAEPIGVVFKGMLRSKVHFNPPYGYFPAQGSYEEHAVDIAERNIFRFVFDKVTALFSFVRSLQRSQIQSYLMYIFLTLIALLIWEVWIGI